MNAVILAQFSYLDLNKLLPAGRQAFERNLAEGPDSVGSQPPLHHMLCVAAIKNPEARNVEDARPYINMFHAGFFIAADERDWLEILEMCGMPCVMVESIARGINVGLISGTLSQWQAAMLRGCQPEVSHEAREVFNKIHTQFKTIGIASAFEFKTKRHSDNTFIIEHK